MPNESEQQAHVRLYEDGEAPSEDGGVPASAVVDADASTSEEEDGIPDYFSTDKIFARVHATAREEVNRSTQILFFSGLAAGLSLGLSFAGMSALTSAVPASEATARLIGSLLYPLGFVLIIGGRYELFTENTLTPVTLVLTRRCRLPVLLRVWGIVMGANVLGTALVAMVLAYTPAFSAEAAQAAEAAALHALEDTWGSLFWNGVFAGWLMASIVWLVHASQESTLRFLIVFFITYAIPVSGFAHCIVGACEGLYLLFAGAASVGSFLSYFSAAALGNTAGGVFLVAVLNYAQTRDPEGAE